MYFFLKLFFRFVTEMSNSILPALLLLSVFKSMTGKSTDCRWIINLALWTVWFCALTHDVLLTLSGADEVLYAQVGETVTLKPPQEYTPSVHYLYWYFGDLELAWRNPHGGSGINDGKQCIELFTYIKFLGCFLYYQYIMQVEIMKLSRFFSILTTVFLAGQDMAKWKDKLSWSGNSLIIKEIPEEQFGTFTCKLPRDKLEKNYKLLKVQGKGKKQGGMISSF